MHSPSFLPNPLSFHPSQFPRLSMFNLSKSPWIVLNLMVLFF